jgi:hypothetical protein
MDLPPSTYNDVQLSKSDHLNEMQHPHSQGAEVRASKSTSRSVFCLLHYHYVRVLQKKHCCSLHVGRSSPLSLVATLELSK